jgi:hypothetical protein
MRTLFCGFGWIVAIVLLTFAVAACAFSRDSHRYFYNPAVQRTCWNQGSTDDEPPRRSSTINTMAPKQQQEQAVTAAVPVWFQHEVKITAPSRGCHLITGDIQKAISGDLSKIKIGMCNLFIQVRCHFIQLFLNCKPVLEY